MVYYHLLEVLKNEVNKENYYQEYKGHTKWLCLISSHFAKNNLFGMTLLHAHAKYIYIVCAKQ